MTLEEAMKMIYDHRAKVKRTKDDWHDGYYDGLTAALMMLSEDDPADTDKPIWEAKDKMTLKELAREMRKILRFRYLTYERNVLDEGEICLWEFKPTYCEGSWRISLDASSYMAIYPEFLSFNLDLSEYRDENGNIDYSKCIVEVTDDIN